MHKSKTSQLGAQGEAIAARFLKRKGYRILERNFQRPWGEIDIIAEKGGEIRFIEVKSVSGEMDRISRENSYRPEEQLHAAKLRKIVRTAELYMADRGGGREFQVDAVAVLMDPTRRVAHCRLYEQIL